MITEDKVTELFCMADDFCKFIRANFKMGEGVTNKIRVNKNNFTHVFQKWLKQVKPTISIDWEEARKEK